MSITELPSHLRQELSFDAEVRRTQTGIKVKKVQEWLTYHGFSTTIDSDFGSATERCVTRFQTAKALPVTGIVDIATYRELVEPLELALKKIDPAPDETLGSMVLKHARQHLAQHPVELGGQNRGAWVRSYMNGNEGTEWPWCAGFVTFVLKQACSSLKRPMPIPGSFGCDVLASQAKQQNLFVSESSIVNGSISWTKLEPCCIFLVRKSINDWTHTGFALEKDTDDTFVTIEGNTNDDGCAEGYEACERTRSLKGKDFIILP